MSCSLIPLFCRLSPFATPRGGGPDCDRDSSSSSSVGGPSIPMPLAPIDHKQSDPMTPTERSTASLNDLEVRLDTSRTTDLFKMQPRACKLQMSPATLDFYRSIKRSIDAEVAFTPTSTNVDVKHSRGHVFVLTDLFLICEHMPAEEKVAKAQEVYRNQPHRIGDGGPMPELWLCYPPLAGRHLAVVSGPMETQLIVTVMKREKFLIQVESRQAREDLLEELQSCIQFSASRECQIAEADASIHSVDHPLFDRRQTGSTTQRATSADDPDRRSSFALGIELDITVGSQRPIQCAGQSDACRKPGHEPCARCTAATRCQPPRTS